MGKLKRTLTEEEKKRRRRRHIAWTIIVMTIGGLGTLLYRETYLCGIDGAAGVLLSITFTFLACSAMHDLVETVGGDR